MDPMTPQTARPAAPAARAAETNGQESHVSGSLHPAWVEFIRFCRQIGHGEIDQLKIQDGLPMLAETVRQRVKFSK
jgi:hypothetical protein